jgi:transcription elongation GreA/GreB family factor
MSRAFVKETDAVPDLPDRPVSAHRNFVTSRGLAMIEAELQRSRAALAEAQAAEDRDAVASAVRELRYWSARRASAELQPPPADSEVVRFGSRVTIERDAPAGSPERNQTFTIVGEDEADPPTGTLSYVSPLARALLGKAVGDIVKAGRREAEILLIEVPDPADAEDKGRHGQN